MGVDLARAVVPKILPRPQLAEVYGNWSVYRRPLTYTLLIRSRTTMRPWLINAMNQTLLGLCHIW
jgi:hypothetical protein